MSDALPGQTPGHVAGSGRYLPPKFDAFDLVGLDDPYPAYRTLRDAGPLCRGGPGQWLVARHGDVTALLRDQRLGQFQFSDAYRMFPDALLDLSLGHGPAATFTEQIIAGRNGSDHAVLRRVMGQALTRRLLHGLRSYTARLADELMARALDRRVLDAAAELALPLPLMVLCELLCVPESDRARVGRQVLTLARIFAPVISDRDRVAADEAVSWLRGYVNGVIQDWRTAPGNDFLAGLLAAEASGQLSRAEIVDNVVFLLFAGIETSIGLVATSCTALARHPDQVARLRSDGSLIPSAVEELLRYDAPTQITGRIVLEPVEIAGRTIRKGRVVLLLLGSANHDERRFAEPERLDVARYPNPHVSFGGGIHHCLGASLARMEGAVLIERLLRRFSRFELAGKPVRERSPALRTYASIPLSVTPA